MQAILIKRLPATDKRPSRIKATCAAGSIVISADYTERNKELAARMIIETRLCLSRHVYPFSRAELPSGDSVFIPHYPDVHESHYTTLSRDPAAVRAMIEQGPE